MPLLRMPIRGLARRSTTCLSGHRILAASLANVRQPASTRSLRTSKGPAGPRNMLQKRPPPLPRQNQPRSKPEATQEAPVEQSEETEPQQSRVDAVSAALREGAENADNTLLSPVHIPEDPHGIIKSNHPATSILANSSIIVQRQLEMMNVFLGFEQANKYVIMDPHGNHIGYLAEKELGFGNTMARQFFKTHRSFETHVFDRNEREVLRFHRPFSYVNSYIRVYDPLHATEQQYSSSSALQGTSATSLVDQTSAQVSQLPVSQMRVIGEAQQQWAAFRRKYNLFLARDPSTLERHQEDTSRFAAGNLPLSPSSKALQVAPNPSEQTFVQFAYVNEPILSWDFSLKRSDDTLLGSVNRNFAGFAREIFTDTGVYALRMDAASVAAEPRHLISQTGHQAQQAQQQQQQTSLVPKETPAMTLDERAVMLATAVSIDFDYFSRHSTMGGGMGLPIPIWIPGVGGGAAAEGGAVGAAGAGAAGAGEIGAAEAGAGVLGGVAARGAGGIGATEGAVAGAGTMAGMEAMQRGRGGQSAAAPDDASPVANEPWNGAGDGQGGGPGQQGQQDVWGEQNQWGQQQQDPWSGQGGDQGWGSGGGNSGGGGGGGGGGGDGGSWFEDFFG